MTYRYMELSAESWCSILAKRLEVSGLILASILDSIVCLGKPLLLSLGSPILNI